MPEKLSALKVVSCHSSSKWSFKKTRQTNLKPNPPNPIMISYDNKSLFYLLSLIVPTLPKLAGTFLTLSIQR
jgi:hypothetical protein